MPRDYTLNFTHGELWCIQHLVRSCDHGRVWDRGEMLRVHHGILTLEAHIDAFSEDLRSLKAQELTYPLEVSEEFLWHIEQQVPPSAMWGGDLLGGVHLLRKVMRALTNTYELPPTLAAFLQEVSNGGDTGSRAYPGDGAADGPAAAALP